MGKINELTANYAVGFTKWFDRVEYGGLYAGKFPQVNIFQKFEHNAQESYDRIEISTPGFERKNLKVWQANEFLFVEGTIGDDGHSVDPFPQPEKGVNNIHRGFERHSFKREFLLHKSVRVESVTYESGLLTITLRVEHPLDALKPVVFDIA